MKPLLIVCFAVISVCCWGQEKKIDSSIFDIPIDTATQLVKYEGVVEANGTKDQLYNKAKIWFADAFKNANYVIQSQDKDAGNLVGKGNFEYTFEQIVPAEKRKPAHSYESKHRASFTIKIFTKDNKFKYIISDISIKDDILNINIELDFTYVAVKVAQTSEPGSYPYNSVLYPNQSFLSLIDNLKVVMKKKDDSDF